MNNLHVQAVWRDVGAQIDDFNTRLSDAPESLDPAPGSELHADDSAGYPFMLSVAVRSCLDASVDHLHALRALILDAGLLHVAAPFSLVRGALENGAVATWMLGGGTRNIRLERVARWYARNLHDWERAADGVPIANADTITHHRILLAAMASRQSVAPSYTSGYTSTEALQATETTFPDLRFGVLFPWQLCSGFAHGRPWAVQGASTQHRSEPAEKNKEDETDIVSIRLTSSLETLLYPVLAAVDLTNAFLSRYEDMIRVPGR